MHHANAHDVHNLNVSKCFDLVVYNLRQILFLGIFYLKNCTSAVSIQTRFYIYESKLPN